MAFSPMVCVVSDGPVRPARQQGPADEGPHPYLLDIQNELLSSLATRLVVPLRPRPDPGFPVIERLHPTMTLGSQDCVAVVSEMAAVPKAALGERMDSLPAFRQAIMDACGLMLTGY